METIELKAEVRETVGKKFARAVRRLGRIPGVLYGKGVTATSVAVDKKEFSKATRTKAGSNVLISLKLEGPRARKATTCLIKEVQRNPVTDEIYHVDFTAISLTDKIKIKVPLSVKGSEAAPGVKEGGVLDVVHHEIEVECLPTEIPERIEADVKLLKIGDSIHLKELSLPPGVAPLLGPEEVIISLRPPQKVEEAAPAAEGSTEPEVIEKGKKEKAEEEGAEPAAGVEATPAEPEQLRELHLQIVRRA